VLELVAVSWLWFKYLSPQLYQEDTFVHRPTTVCVDD